MKNALVLLLAYALTAPSAYAIVDGSHDQDGLFPSTLKVGSIACSAVQISDRHLLTAAHCVRRFGQEDTVDFSGSDEKARAVQVGVGRETYFLSYKKISFHPSWHRLVKKEEDIEEVVASPEMSDLAIIEIEQKIPYVAAKVSFSGARMGEGIFLTGFGSTSEHSGKLADDRGFMQSLVVTSPELGFFLAPSPYPKSQSHAHVGHGDSGGGVYRRTASGELELIGIISFEGKFSHEVAPEDPWFAGAARLDRPSVKAWICSLVSLLGCPSSGS